MRECVNARLPVLLARRVLVVRRIARQARGARPARSNAKFRVSSFTLELLSQL
jgi:hypothetical protein